MKRQGWLIHKIASMENLQLAYYKAQRGKMKKAEVQVFGRRLQSSLRELQQQILSGEVEAGGYHYFTIYEPKQRMICSAPFSQRVLHHALMNICHPFFDRQQVAGSFASRTGKGTCAALDRARYYHRRYAWFLKLDVRKYFDSIDHDILKEQLFRLFKDVQLLRILAKIIDSYAVVSGKGVPIGNLTSQYFANHYLSSVDHRMFEVLHLPGYVRYMDDMVLWDDNQERLLHAGRELEFQAKTNLKLSLKPFCLNRCDKGMPFLGYLLYPDCVRLSQRSRRRFVAKADIYAKRLMSGEWSQHEYATHVRPLESFTEYAESTAFRRSVYCRIDAFSA